MGYRLFQMAGLAIHIHWAPGLAYTSPYERQQRFVLIQKAYLKEHTFDIPTDGNVMLAEPEQSYKERETQSWARQKTFVQILSHVFEGAVKYNSEFVVVFNNMMWEIPSSLWLGYLLTGDFLNITRLHKPIQLFFVLIRQFGIIGQTSFCSTEQDSFLWSFQDRNVGSSQQWSGIVHYTIYFYSVFEWSRVRASLSCFDLVAVFSFTQGKVSICQSFSTFISNSLLTQVSVKCAGFELSKLAFEEPILAYFVLLMGHQGGP